MISQDAQDASFQRISYFPPSDAGILKINVYVCPHKRSTAILVFDKKEGNKSKSIFVPHSVYFLKQFPFTTVLFFLKTRAMKAVRNKPLRKATEEKSGFFVFVIAQTAFPSGADLHLNLRFPEHYPQFCFFLKTGVDIF